MGELDDKRLEQKANKERTKEFFSLLKQNDTLLTEFDEDLWNATVEKVLVRSERGNIFVFKDGMELEWEI